VKKLRGQARTGARDKNRDGQRLEQRSHSGKSRKKMKKEQYGGEGQMCNEKKTRSVDKGNTGKKKGKRKHGGAKKGDGKTEDGDKNKGGGGGGD